MPNGWPIAFWGRVLSDGVELGPARVVVSGEHIVAVEHAARSQPGDIEVEDGWIAPGLIDLQVNGANGVDLTSSSDVESVARTLAAHGVTAFCPTVVSSSQSILVDRLAAYQPRSIRGGAASLGPHIEGPFLADAHRGVHDPLALRDASAEEIQAWLAAGRPTIVTLAPERPGGLVAIEQLVQAGVLVSLGHSGADVEATRAGLVAGARMATHVFNAMPPLHHRQPGMVGALLASEAVLGLIADGVHLDPLLVDLVIRRAGQTRVVLVSDALAAAGAPPGPSLLGQQTVISDGQSVRRADGTLAGSASLLDACLRNVRAWLPDLPPAELVRMVTSTPADVLGLGRKGRVAVDFDADLVVLGEDFSVRLTTVRGEVVEVDGTADPERRTGSASSAVHGLGLARAGERSQANRSSASAQGEALDELPTELPNPRTANLDRLNNLGTLELINDEDQLVAPAARAALPALARAVDLAFERWNRGGRIILFGAGTSGRLAALDAAELGPTFNVPAERYLARMAGGRGAFETAVEGAEDDRDAGAQAAADLTAGDLAFGLAASGRTPWVVGALEGARRRGAATVALACVSQPRLAGYADVCIVVDTGPEPISGSTRMKAGIAQKLILNAFSTALMTRLGKVYGNLMVDVRATNEKLRRRAVRLVRRAATVGEAEAISSLADASGEVKTAIAMLRLGVSATEARQRLELANGHLRTILGES